MYIDYMKGTAVKIEILHFPDNPKRFFTYKHWFDHREGLVEELATMAHRQCDPFMIRIKGRVLR